MDTKKHDQPISKPDPETLHTTDPQEHMKGPLSSSMQGIRETAEENDHPSNKRVDEKQDESRAAKEAETEDDE